MKNKIKVFVSLGKQTNTERTMYIPASKKEIFKHELENLVKIFYQPSELAISVNNEGIEQFRFEIEHSNPEKIRGLVDELLEKFEKDFCSMHNA